MEIGEAHFIAVDTETSGIDSKESEVIEVGMARMKSAPPPFLWSSLVMPKGDIPPTASAVNHIVKSMCEGSPGIKELEPAITKYSEGCIIAAHNAEFDRSFIPCLKDNIWLCTKRLAQHLFPSAPGYSLQVLRYWLELDTPSGDPHRAAADASLCASLLEREIEVYLKQGRPDDAEMLVAYADSPIIYKNLTFGQYRNQPISDIVKKDRQYLSWVLKSWKDLDEDMRQSIIVALR